MIWNFEFWNYRFTEFFNFYIFIIGFFYQIGQ